jgi:hypothetical protein
MLEPNSHLIHPLTSKFVNDNGDTWSNESLKANYKSFVGAFNYVNHEQVPEKSVGFIADVALRRISLNPAKKVYVHYADILVATHRDFSKIASMVLSDQIEFMSMGCDTEVSTCSKCGNISTEDDDQCKCLSFSKGKAFIDDRGKRRVIAEILGNNEPGSVTFIEASYLTQVPAFSGACKRHVLAIPNDHSIEIEMSRDSANKEAVQRFFDK